MDIVANALSRVVKAIRGRSMAAVLLAVVCLVTAVIAAANFTSVNIIDGGERKTVITMRSDAKEILTQAGIALANDDEIVVDELEDSNAKEITILRAFDIFVKADGETKTVQIVGGTVADALTEAEIEFPRAADIINYSVEDELIEGMEIVIDRIEYKTTSKKEVIAFKTVNKKDPNLKKGTNKVSVKGVNGEKEIVYQVKYVNGEKVSSEIISEKITKKAIDKQVLVGTGIVQPKTAKASKASSSSTSSSGGTVLDANGVPLSYRKLLTGTATAYTAKSGAKTSTGKPAKYGNVAVNPKVIPYGTKMYIVSSDGKFVYGTAIAADTGSALMSGNVLVDLYYGSYSQCSAFGRRQVKVYIL